MPGFNVEKTQNEVILIARILMVVLFLVFGWGKLMAPSGTAAYFAQGGIPMPAVATAVAIVMEFFVGIAIVVGLFTRPLAILLAAYTLATAFMGHPFWHMTGSAYTENEINFLKNISIIGGLLLLYVTGPGRYSLDAALRRT